MLEGSVSTSPPPKAERGPNLFEIVLGAFFLILVLPAISIALGELSQVADSLEYDGTAGDIRNSLIYSLTSIMTLFALGLYYLGAIKTKIRKQAAGGTLIALALFNFLCRLGDFQRELQRNREGGWDGPILEFLSSSSTHERIELVFLGAIIGLLVMKK